MVIVYSFRFTHYFTKNKFRRIVGIPVIILYKIIIQWFLCVDIPPSTKIGDGLEVFHGMGLVVHPDVIIGSNVVLRHNTTIGNAREGGGCPVIGDNVEIGANSVVIGEIVIGNKSVIAAGSVAVKDVPEGVIVAGNPAKIINMGNNA